MSQRHYIMEWRRFRGLTQSALAERIEMAMTNLSRIERGQVAYTQQTLEKIAKVLNCTPADLIGRSPEQGAEISDVWGDLDKDAQGQILALAKMLLRKP